jgi:hypothetical protein
MEKLLSTIEQMLAGNLQRTDALPVCVSSSLMSWEVGEIYGTAFSTYGGVTFIPNQGHTKAIFIPLSQIQAIQLNDKTQDSSGDFTIIIHGPAVQN